MSGGLLERLSLQGLTIAPSQAWNSVRLVPLIRAGAPGDLRLAKRTYKESLMVVSLDGELLGDGVKYVSYVPHGLVVSWTDDGSPAATFGASMATHDGKRFGSFVRVAHRMVKREDRNRLRLLPLHLAMEGFLALHYGGPDVAWAEYSRQAISRGLDPRWESSVSGRMIRGLEDALRVFEIHEDQVGVLVFVADAFASAFVVSHPEDYRDLHRSLLEDFYGELMYQYGLQGTSGHMEASLDTSGVRSLDDLERALASMRTAWADFHEYMAAGVFHRALASTRVYRCGPFQLQRFSTDLDPKGENHVGEAIVRVDGTVEYLKTYRLSAAQTRRAYLLNNLAAHNWNIDATASGLGQSREEFVRRLEKAHFGYLLKDHVLHEARRRRR